MAEKKAKNKPLKQPNGTGTVYKLSGRRRKPWVARVTTGKKYVVPQKGKYAGQEVARQEFQILGYYEEKSEARAALLSHQISPISSKAGITLEELYKEWSEGKFKRVSRSAVDNWSAAWQKLKPLHNQKFKELRTSHIQTIIDSIASDGYSRSSLEKIKGVATMLYKYALQNDIVDKSYAEFLVLPKETKKEKEVFSDLDIKKLFDSVDTEPWADTILIMIYTGLRISEMLELTRFNVDMTKQIITGGIKTDAGKNRVIPIHPKILPFIKKWYNNGGEALITGKKGKVLDGRYYREKKYYPILDRLNLTRLNPHCCRHTFASLMARAKANPLYIQKIIGHSDYAFTANQYTHTEVEDLRKAINLI